MRTNKNTNFIELPKIFYSLEALRFIAAFIVFYGHFIHFFDLEKANSNLINQTFEKFLSPYGGLAVPTFFLISGFIFMFKYFDEIKFKKISFKEFFLRRFARLYPLHIFTLMIVVILQFFYFNVKDNYFIYIVDIKHFILQIFFISNWGFETNNSFNGPVWSVSQEVFLYFCFFIFAYISNYFSKKYLAYFFPAIVLLIVSIILPKYHLDNSISTFFLGTYIFCVIINLIKNKSLKRQGLVILIILILLQFYFMIFNKRFIIGIPFALLGPILIYILVLIEISLQNKIPSLVKKISIFLGNLSYTSYLMHFPIQLFIANIYIRSDLIDITSSVFLLIYILLVLLTSIIVFYLYEKKMKIYILNKYISKKKSG